MTEDKDIPALMRGDEEIAPAELAADRARPSAQPVMGPIKATPAWLAAYPFGDKDEIPVSFGIVLGLTCAPSNGER
jgi:hypothetical protein